MKDSLKTFKTKGKYSGVSGRGRFITCKICNHLFKHSSAKKKMKWLNTKFKCPKCKSHYCNKPETERVLMVLQDKYLKKKDRRLLARISRIVIRYTESILKKNFSSYISTDTDMQYHRDKASSFLVEEFCAKEHYNVWGSWAGLIDKKIRQSLFEKNEKPIQYLIKERHKKQKLQIVNLNYLTSLDGNYMGIEDPSQTKYMASVDRKFNKELFTSFTINTLKIFIERFSMIEILRMIKGINIKLYSSDTRAVKYFKQFNDEGKWAYIQFWKLYSQELNNILN